MHVVLFLVGIVLAFAGAVLIYAVPVPVVDAGAAALFGSGALAMVGGLVLMGLAAVVRVLNRIAERLEIQPLPVPPIASVGREDPAPRPARPQQPVAAPAPAPAARPSLLGWFGRGSAPVPATAARATVQRATPAPEVVEPPAVDLAPLTRVEEPRAPAPVPPPAAASLAAPTPPPPPPKPVIPKPAARPAAPAPANGTPETTVYKSGVIDGMAYTLFMDGAIEAELPQGRVKFGSIDELQKYLTSGQ
jgi:hypothetical protein